MGRTASRFRRKRKKLRRVFLRPSKTVEPFVTCHKEGVPRRVYLLEVANPANGRFNFYRYLDRVPRLRSVCPILSDSARFCVASCSVPHELVDPVSAFRGSYGWNAAA